MKKLTQLVAVTTALWLAASPVALAADGPNPQTFNVSASVDGSLTLSANLFKALPNNGGPGASITSFAFGQLQEVTFENPNGPPFRELRSSDTGTGALMGAGVALLSANSHGVPYTIRQEGTALTSGANTIPTGACVVNTAYSTEDNGGQALVGSLGQGGPWNVQRTLYTSNAAGDIRTMQAYYSVTGDPAANATAAVPVTQPAGNYAATVTFTAVAS